MDVAVELAASLLQVGKLEPAWQAIEAAKARALSSLLAQSDVRPNDGFTEAERRNEKRLAEG